MEIIEGADGIASAADTGDEIIRKTSCLLHDLPANLLANDLLEVADNGRIRMWTDGRTDDVMRVFNVRRPVANRLARRIFQRACAAGNGDDLCTEKLHAEDIQLLTFNVQRAHEDMALHAKECRNRRGSNAVLPCARLCDDALFPHALCQKCLPQCIVDLMRTCMQQVLTL